MISLKLIIFVLLTQQQQQPTAQPINQQQTKIESPPLVQQLKPQISEQQLLAQQLQQQISQNPALVNLITQKPQSIGTIADASSRLGIQIPTQQQQQQ